MTKRENDQLKTALSDTIGVLERVRERHESAIRFEEVGRISAIGRGIAWIVGLAHLQSEELVALPGDRFGMALNLDAERTGIVLLDREEGLEAGQEVHRTNRVMDVPVGEALLGRVVDPLGRPLDGKDAIRAAERRPIEREAPPVMDRSAVTIPLETGIQVVDALIPIGRGQRELILGDRQTGKTALALGSIINQKDKGIVSVYCAIGQENSTVAKVVADLERNGAMERTIVVVAAGNDTPGLNFVAAYAATSMAEYFMEQGDDVLIVYDDLTRHARSYRELSLLLRRPPAREAFPGDIFYIHSRLLERSARLKKGGSLTALPIVETEAQDISAYIPTNLISITDGQIYLSPHLFEEGMLPAVDVGLSVSRVGGKTQLPAYRKVAGDLRLSYSQYEELEAFARFGTRLDEQTRKALERGRRVREVLKQSQYEPVPASEQVAVLLALTSGVLDDVDVSGIKEAKPIIRKTMRESQPGLSRQIASGEELSDEDRASLVEAFKTALKKKAD
ncbi:MAG: alternate F1F0 ATPase, F1 subunit alpha [Dehalococcoidia bacterium]|nr:alternate F1F0 ATPase, F1 subunit alpha [Dehalococcoidia bacterium]